MDAKQTVSNYADQLGVGPRDSSTLDKGSELVSKGIDTVQNSVFGRRTDGQQQQQGGGKGEATPHVPEVDRAHLATVEEMMREKHRSEPVSGNIGKE